MLTVTEAAGTGLAQILEQEGLPAEVAIRLISEGKALAVQPDSERPGDTTFKHEGHTVLLLDEQIAQSLADNTLDAECERLTLRRAQDAE